MATDFPITYSANHNGYDMQYFKPAAAATFKAFSLVVLNTGTGEVDECGADPALILGVAYSTAAMKTLYDGRVPVAILTADFEVGLCSATTPIATDVGKDWGIVKLASGNWSLDHADAVNTRVHCYRVDIAQGIFWCRFLAANLQSDAVVS